MKAIMKGNTHCSRKEAEMLGKNITRTRKEIIAKVSLVNFSL